MELHNPPGPAGIARTLFIMKQLANIAKSKPQIRTLAESIINNGGCGSKQYECEVNHVQEWVRGNVVYTRDIRGVEFVQSPGVLLKTRRGDCDDQATLVAALLMSLGHGTRMYAMGTKKSSFSHVVCETLLAGEWVAVETTEPNVGVGWYPAGLRAHMRLQN